MLDKLVVSDELGRFADLDSRFIVSLASSELLVQFHQYGEKVELSLDVAGGLVRERRASGEKKHATYRGLLGSEHFGNLRRFVEAQRALLTRDAPYLFDASEQLPVYGDFYAESFDSSRSSSLIGQVTDWLGLAKTPGRQRALVIDGPAGIGKTHFVRSLVYQRIKAFGPGAPAPILHVQSHGRKLTTLNDVIAGTLNTLRVALTYEQLPILARHGLIDIAIDGFDELADPNGYETAWSSLRDFVEDIEGHSSLILAGRDTFIDASQVRKSLPRLDTSETGTVHLRTLPPSAAREWLLNQNVSPGSIQSLEQEGLLESDSYALRPFFVLQIRNAIAGGAHLSNFLEHPLSSLIAGMISREADIFVQSIKKTDSYQIESRLDLLFCEIARDMADGERDWIDEATLVLVIDMVFGDILQTSELGILRHRAQAIALLEPDTRVGRRRFPHSEILDYFLSKALLTLLTNGDIPKCVRRNIFGTDFLESFHDVVASANIEIGSRFLSQSMEMLRATPAEDRSKSNLAALVLAAVSEMDTDIMKPKLSSLTMDEACVRGTVSNIELFDINIGQLDCRGADLTRVKFDRCGIASLIADDFSLLPESFPSVNSLSFMHNGRLHTEYSTPDILAWLDGHRQGNQKTYRPSAALNLLDRVCRVILRQNWIRSIPEDRAGKLLEDPLWPAIQKILQDENLIAVRERVGVGGPKSDFLRVRHPKNLLEAPDGDQYFASIRNRISALG